MNEDTMKRALLSLIATVLTLMASAQSAHWITADDSLRNEPNESNTYQIIRHGKHKLLHQTPWYDEEGNVAGLIELAIDLPNEMPVFNRDKE